MRNRIIISLDEVVDQRPNGNDGRNGISQHINAIPYPHPRALDLTAVYQEMSADEEREADAEEWAEATLGDVADETQ